MTSDLQYKVQHVTFDLQHWTGPLCDLWPYALYKVQHVTFDLHHWTGPVCDLWPSALYKVQNVTSELPYWKASPMGTGQVQNVTFDRQHWTRSTMWPSTFNTGKLHHWALDRSRMSPSTVSTAQGPVYAYHNCHEYYHSYAMILNHHCDFVSRPFLVYVYSASEKIGHFFTNSWEL